MDYIIRFTILYKNYPTQLFKYLFITDYKIFLNVSLSYLLFIIINLLQINIKSVYYIFLLLGIYLFLCRYGFGNIHYKLRRF